ncbi:MAG: hypothetical protein DMG71_07965, partial [Acidobacteria bacterium]
YHGLLLSLRHHSHQLLSSVAYTYSKTTDQGTGYFNQFDQASQRGPSQLDQPHRLVIASTWSPEVRPLRHFEIGAVINIASGRPYNAVFDNPEVNFSIVPGERFNSFRGPNVRNFDFNVTRNFHLGERYVLRFTAEAFNVFNHPNYQQNTVDNVQYTLTQQPDAGVNNSVWTAAPNSNFGAPLAMVPRFGARSFQFSSRFSF